VEAVLIQNPVFRIDVRRQAQAITVPSNSVSLAQKVKDFSKSVFAYVQLFFSALWDARRGIVFYTVFAARISVGVSLVPSTMLMAAAIAIAITWAGAGIVVFVYRIYSMKRPDQQSGKITPLDCSEYTKGSPIDLNHLKATTTKMDMSTVPASLKIETLKEMLCLVPMKSSEKGKPGYIAEPTLYDSATLRQRVFSKEELIVLMQKLIDNINCKRPWLGVPNPDQDKAGCDRFYQKLSDLLRFTFYKVHNDVQEFITKECKGEIPQKPQGEHPDATQLALFKKYVDLVEERNRFLVDIACVGNYCGGRAMGEALDAFCRLTGQAQEDQGSLEERIGQVLTTKRLEIIRADIGAVYPNNAHNTHYFAAYLSQLGEALGIPGAEGATEHLTKIDNRKMLVRFFGQYTPEAMTQAIVDKYRSSEGFRDLVIEWFKQQVGAWNQTKYEEAYTQIHLEQILQDQKIIANGKVRANKAQAWLTHLQNVDACKDLCMQKEDGKVVIVIDGKKKLLCEASPAEVMTELFTLSKEYIQKRSDLWSAWEVLQRAADKLPNTFTFTTENNLDAIFATLWTQQGFKNEVRKSLQIQGKPKTLAETVESENTAFAEWTNLFKQAQLQPLQLREFIVAKAKKNGQEILKKKVLDRCIHESIKTRWQAEMFCPEFIPLLEGIVKKSPLEVDSLAKSFRAQEQYKLINQRLTDGLEAPISADLRASFVDAIQKNELPKLQQMIKNHLQRARETEFFSALMKGNNPSQEEADDLRLTEDMGRWLLISHGILTY